MPVQVSWYVEGYILLQQFSHQMTMDELREAGKLSTPLIREAGMEKVYIVMDLSQVRDVAVSITQMRFDPGKVLVEASEEWAVMIRPAEALVRNQVNFISRALTYMFGYLFFTCDTLDEGIQFLIGRDEHLRELLTPGDQPGA